MLPQQTPGGDVCTYGALRVRDAGPQDILQDDDRRGGEEDKTHEEDTEHPRPELDVHSDMRVHREAGGPSEAEPRRPALANLSMHPS